MSAARRGAGRGVAFLRAINVGGQPVTFRRSTTVEKLVALG